MHQQGNTTLLYIIRVDLHVAVCNIRFQKYWNRILKLQIVWMSQFGKRGAVQDALPRERRGELWSLCQECGKMKLCSLYASNVAICETCVPAMWQVLMCPYQQGTRSGGGGMQLCEKAGSLILEPPLLYRIWTWNSKLQRKDVTNMLARQQQSVIWVE